MTGILGKKIGMTQIIEKDGRAIGVTVIQSGDCPILQVKTKKSDGYDSIQLGFEETKETKVKKPQLMRFKKAKIAPQKFIKEILVNDAQNYKVGQVIDIQQFSSGDFVDISARSKGKGFQGGMKRWNWSGGPKSHGSMSHRSPGSIGASAYPSRVVKGHHLPGHMGSQKVIVQNLEVIKVDKENNLLVVKGSIPGPNNCYLVIKKSMKKSKVVKKEPDKQEQKK
ncbi:MAG: 50S ribosomal protein L3 [Candidatus Omnitrophica bacterium]|nr:50S ribosomal protein L3 [Candidatus Omnitrophota bacterium]